MNRIFFNCADVRFELAAGNELLVAFLPKSITGHKTFFTPLAAFDNPIGWIEFAYAFTVHGKSFYRAIRLHQVGDVNPAPTEIRQLLSASANSEAEAKQSTQAHVVSQLSDIGVKIIREKMAVKDSAVEISLATPSKGFSIGVDQLGELRTTTFEQDAIGKIFSVDGNSLPPLPIDELGKLDPSTSDSEYAAAMAEAGETPPLLNRIEAACVTLGHGAKETGYRTLHALMHPSNDLQPPACNREAAAIIFLTIAGLLKDAPPEVIARISRAINERIFSSAGLL